MRIDSQEAQEGIIEAVDQNMAIAELEPLGLSIRTITGLEDKLGLIYLKDLLNITLDELKSVKNLGTQAVREVEVALNNIHRLTNKVKAKHLRSVAPLLGRAVQMRDTKVKKTEPKYDGAGRKIE